MPPVKDLVEKQESKVDDVVASQEELEAVKSENEMLKEQLAKLAARIDGLESKPEPAKKSDKPVLDKKRPFTEQRQVGGFWFEQDGNKFSAKGEFVEKLKGKK